MNRFSALFLRAVTGLIGLGVLALMLWEPHLEGRNAHATTFEIYFQDPFLAYAYAASIPFFLALFQAFKLLGAAGQDRLSPQVGLKGLRTIKFCAIAMMALVVAGEIIFILPNESDDRAGGVFMGLLVSFGALGMAASAALLERSWKNGLDKSGAGPAH